ncbi:MAG: hypothetical protein AB8G86_27280 [Saprospiraceae bacterium]
MRTSFLLKSILFLAIFLITACEKDDATEPSIEGTYDIIGYSVIDCEEFDVILDNEKEACSVIEGLEFCVDGTFIFTADLLTINLNFTADGESDGSMIESSYTIEGNEITLCFTPDDCETSNFKFEEEIVEITSPVDDGCYSSIRARKRG